MQSFIFDRQLQVSYSRVTRRASAFSLAELIVSMGILMLMLALAGQVMSLTVKATGQANALTEVNRALRILEQTLREDLRHVRPGNSIILIQGNPINAYWTQVGKESDPDGNPANGYLHLADPERENPTNSSLMNEPRADILMFFTTREAGSFVQYRYVTPPPNLGQEVISGVQQVVYGHANLFEYARDGTRPLVKDIPHFPADPATYWPVPAERWHLARRMVHLLDLQSDPPDVVRDTAPWACAINQQLDGPDEEDGDPNRDLLGNPAILLGKTDVMTGFDYEAQVLTALGADPAQGGDPELGAFPLYWPPIFKVEEPEYGPFSRSLLDPTPPPGYADRLGHYFLPYCASFKVEWTLDPDSAYVDGRLDGEKQVYWFDPGDETNPLATLVKAANSFSGPPEENYLQELLEERVGGDAVIDATGALRPDFQYSLEERFGNENPLAWHSHPWGDESRPNLAVFTATRRKAAPVGVDGELTPEEIFPKALRITVDLFDKERRLERPIRHVMVVPVGE